MTAYENPRSGPVLLVTADPAIRAGVHRFADRVGAHLIDHGNLTGAVPEWHTAALALLGADILTTVGADPVTVLPRPGQLIVVSMDRPDFDLFGMAMAARDVRDGYCDRRGVAH